MESGWGILPSGGHCHQPPLRRGGSNLGFLHSCSDRACVSAASWPWLDPGLPRLRETKPNLSTLLRSLEMAPNTTTQEKNTRGLPFFCRYRVQKLCKSCDFDCSWNTKYLLYGCLYKQRFIVSRKMVQLYFYSCAKALCRYSKEKQVFCRQNLQVHYFC